MAVAGREGRGYWVSYPFLGRVFTCSLSVRLSWRFAEMAAFSFLVLVLSAWCLAVFGRVALCSVTASVSADTVAATVRW